MRMSFRVTYLVLSLFILSFGKSDGPVEKFQQWYASHHDQLVISHEVGELNYSLRFLPKELNITREALKLKAATKKDLKALSKKYDGLYEFSFKVQSAHIQDILAALSVDEQDYNDRLFYLLDQIGNDFTLVTELGELKPLRCSFENNYGAAPFITLHLVFEHLSKNKLKQLAYVDQFFGCGNLVFELSEIEQLNIPKIK